MSQSGIPIVEDVAGAVGDVGSALDDFVNDVVPFGWYGVAAATGLYYAPEIAALADAAETAAIAEGATATEAANIGAQTAAQAAATTAESQATNYLGSTALGSAETGAVGSGTTGFGLSAGTTGGAASGTGISTASLAGTPLGAGMGTVGTEAASGLGYLGGAEALPAGTAGITGVTAPTTLSLSDAQRALKLGQSLFGQQPQTPTGFPKRQTQPYGAVDYSPTLSLLQQRVSTPNVYSLLG